MAVFFALFTLFSWGIGDVLVAIASRRIGNKNAFFIWLVLGFIISSFYIPFAGPVQNNYFFIIAVILNIFGILGTLLYFQALELGNASLVGTIAGSFPVITVPLSIILFKEHLSSGQILAVILIIFGLILSTVDWSRKLKADKGIIMAFVTLIIWGIFWAFMRYPVEKIGWFWSGYAGYFFIILMLPFVRIGKKEIKSLYNLKFFTTLFFMSFLTVAGSFSYYLGLTYGYTSIVAPIAGASPVVFVIISRFVFRERLIIQQKLGIVFALAGIVLIGISSV